MHLRTLFGSSLPTRVGIGLSWPLYICDLKEERHWKMVATLDTNAKSKPGFVIYSKSDLEPCSRFRDVGQKHEDGG